MTVKLVSLNPEKKMTVGMLCTELCKLVQAGNMDFTILLVSHHEDDYHEPKRLSINESDHQLVIW